MDGFSSAAPARRPVRLPEPGRVRARLCRELARLDRLSYADGLAKAYRCAARPKRRVVAVIGDGALTGGMAWEALNNIAGAKDRPRGHRGQRQRPVLPADDRRAGRPPRFGPGHPALRAGARLVKTTLSHTPLVGPPLFETLHGIKKGLKDVLQPQVLFEDLGLKYLGPVDGHDEQARRARAAPGPGVRRPGPRARDHQEGPRLPAGRGERRGLPAPGPAGRGPTADRRRRRRPAAGREAALDPGVRRRAGRDRRPPARRGGHHRRDAAPDRPGQVRRARTRSGSSTSASPSSTR